jgi:hypothetical protein
MSTRDLQGQIDALKSELEELRALVRPRPPTPSMRVIDEGVRVSYPRPEPVVLPTESELLGLLNILARSHPKLASDDAEARASFASAIHWLSYARRTEKLNADRAISFFADLGNEWFRRHNLRGHMDGRGVMAAAICSRVLYSIQPASLALSIGGEVEHDPDLTWRKTLNAGSVLPPMTVQQAYAPEPSRVRITGGNTVVGRG